MLWPTCLFYSTMSFLWLCLLINFKLCLPMTLLSRDWYIQSRFVYFIIFHQFKSIFILYQPIKNLYFKSRWRLFTFVFAPCTPSIKPQSTTMVTLTIVLLRFICHLFEHVVPLVLSVLLWTHHFLLTLSLLFVQRAGAFLLLLHFIDPHTCFSMFSCLLGEFFTLESCPFILPCFSNFKQVFSSICLCAARLSFHQFRCFCKSLF